MEQIDTLIIGAGPSGLAMGRELSRRAIPFVMVDRAQTVGSSWRSHYDRLHLHTAKAYSALPGMSFPRAAPRFPSRDDVVAYLEAYAQRFEIRPRFGVEVERVERGDDGWHVRSSAGELRARVVVVAGGRNAVPWVPTWPGQESFTGEILHTADYRNGDRWRGKRVLVVGSGNSGAEIALDLTERGARADLCVRGKLLVAERVSFGLPTPLPTILLTKLPLALGDAIARAGLRRTVGDLSSWGIEAPEYGPIRSIVEHGRVPLIDVGTVERIKRGEIVVRRGIDRFEPDGVAFVDGDRQSYEAVVLGTGYRAGLGRFIERGDELVDDMGRAERGGEEARPGLYLVGYSNPPTGFLREIAREAQRAARHIAKNR